MIIIEIVNRKKDIARLLKIATRPSPILATGGMTIGIGILGADIIGEATGTLGTRLGTTAGTGLKGTAPIGTAMGGDKLL